jgi:Lon-like ATP-dependent protease
LLVHYHVDLKQKQINLQLSGKKIGQINGLSVVELIGSPTEFGEIFRVSARIAFLIALG